MIVENPSTGRLEPRLWKHDEALVQIPNLAIHLSDEYKTFSWDNEAHLRPIIATSIIDQLMDESDEKPEEVQAEETKEDTSISSIHKKHFNTLLNLIAEGIEVDVEKIVDFELCLFDVHESSIMGIHKEFISSPRLDNMCSSTIASFAMAERAGDEPDDQSVDMIVLYDHEEIGSVSN